MITVGFFYSERMQASFVPLSLIESKRHFVGLSYVGAAVQGRAFEPTWGEETPASGLVSIDSKEVTGISANGVHRPWETRASLSEKGVTNV